MWALAAFAVATLPCLVLVRHAWDLLALSWLVACALLYVFVCSSAERPATPSETHPKAPAAASSFRHARWGSPSQESTPDSEKLAEFSDDVGSLHRLSMEFHNTVRPIHPPPRCGGRPAPHALQTPRIRASTDRGGTL